MARKAGLQLTVGIDDAAALKKAKALMGILRSENAKMAAVAATEARRNASVALSEERVVTQATKTLVEQTKVRKGLADAIKAETNARRALAQEEIAANRRNRSGFMTALNTSRVAVPGTNRDVMPLVGQTVRGGVGAVAGMALVGAIGGAGQLVASGVQEAASLEQSLMRLQGRTGATDAQLQQLRKTARELGADLTLPGIASTDAAQAIETLTAKGLSLEDSMNGAKGALQLAVVGTLNFKEAAEITADALNQFQLQGTEATRVADAFAAASVKSGTPVRELYEALRAVGPVAKQAGASLEDTLTMLGMFGRSGLRGSDAGTSMKTFLLALQAPTKEAEAALKRLGVTAYNAEGQMRPLRSIIEDLANGLKGQTEAQQNAALKTIFGTDAIRAAVVAAGSGVKQFDEFKKAIEAQGTAAKQAEAQTRGLKGAMDGFDSTLKSLLEKSTQESGLVKFLTEVVDLGTNALTALDDMMTSYQRLQNAKPPMILEYLQGANEMLRNYLKMNEAAASPLGRATQTREDITFLRDYSKTSRGLQSVADVFNGRNEQLNDVLERYLRSDSQGYFGKDGKRITSADAAISAALDQAYSAQDQATKQIRAAMVPSKPVTPTPKPRPDSRGGYPTRPSAPKKPRATKKPIDFMDLGIGQASLGIDSAAKATRYQQQENEKILAAKRSALEAELGRKEDAEQARRAEADAQATEARVATQTLQARLKRAEEEEDSAGVAAAARELYEDELAQAKLARDEGRKRIAFDVGKDLVRSLQNAKSGADILSAMDSSAAARAAGIREVNANYDLRVGEAGDAQAGRMRSARELAQKNQGIADEQARYLVEQAEAKRIEGERRVQEESQKAADMRREDREWVNDLGKEALDMKTKLNELAKEPFAHMQEQIARSVGESIGQFRSLKDFLQGWKSEVLNIFKSLVSEIITNWARVQIMGSKGPGAGGGALLAGIGKVLPGAGIALGAATVIDRVLGKNNPLRKLGIRGLATGGPAGAGEVFLGAEAGPEIFLGSNGAVNVLPTPGLYSPKVPGSVLSNRQVAKVAAALGGGGGGKTVIHAPINVENVYEASDLHTLEAARVRKLSGGLAFS